MEKEIQYSKDVNWDDLYLSKCLANDIGMDYDIEAKWAETQCKNNWKSLVSFCNTNDGIQVEGLEAKGDLNHPDYCIVYVSFNTVISNLGPIWASMSSTNW